MFGLERLWKREGGEGAPTRPRLASEEVPALIYAIGDVHGCVSELVKLERMIVEDAAETIGEKWIVLLGDYIDRGPASAAVVAHIRAAPPAGFRRFCLAGNHEQLFVDALRHPRLGDQWLMLGGDETARSYGLPDRALAEWQRNPRRVISTLQTAVPEDDVEWLETLPVSLSIPGWVFVHAGARPGVPLESQRDYDLIWTRLPDTIGDTMVVPGARMVHGHTPVNGPVDERWRICIDTGAYATGVLTALRIRDGREAGFISTGTNATRDRTVQHAR
jgi:serine/threonine protein phosphatase 1